MLMVFGGLPGKGKTTIARELARQLGAVHVRIDSIEQTLRDYGLAGGSINDDVGYRVAYAVAADNLSLGRVVIADSVNPLQVTRDAWVTVAKRAGAGVVEAEVCLFRCKRASKGACGAKRVEYGHGKTG